VWRANFLPALLRCSIIDEIIAATHNVKGLLIINRRIEAIFFDAARHKKTGRLDAAPP
jgi:hypothetical protein